VSSFTAVSDSVYNETIKASSTTTVSVSSGTCTFGQTCKLK
jgi:hypothetical protein